ncbi:unnamed protein product, partial [Brassica rapa subsp. trilocularis]
FFGGVVILLQGHVLGDSSCGHDTLLCVLIIFTIWVCC